MKTTLTFETSGEGKLKLLIRLAFEMDNRVHTRQEKINMFPYPLGLSIALEHSLSELGIAKKMHNLMLCIKNDGCISRLI